MQSKQEQENPESFSWFLKTFKEQQQQQQQSKVDEQPNQAQEIQILRFIKIVEPSVEKLMEIGKTELNLSVLGITEILEKLEENDEIVFEMISKSDGDANTPASKEKIAKITPQGQTRLKSGG